MKRRRNLIVAALLAVAAFVVTACDVSDHPTSSWQADAASTSNVYATARIGNLVVLGGNFTSVTSPDGKQTVRSGGLAAFDAGTGAFRWTAAPGGTVYKIVADGNTLWVFGDFGLKKYDATGNYNTAYRPNLTGIGTMRGAMDVGPNAVYVAGSGAVKAINKASGAIMWTTPIVGGQAWTLSYAQANPGPRIIIGGYFCTVGRNNISRPGLASLGTNGAVDTRFNATAFNCGLGLPNRFDAARSVLASVPYGTSVFVGGGGSLNRAAKVDVNTGAVQWAAPTGDGDVQAVAIQGSYLYIGGHFTCVQSSARGCLAPRQKAARYLLSNNSLSSNWQPAFRGGFAGVWSITGDGAALYVGGNFTSVNGATHQKFVIFRP